MVAITSLLKSSVEPVDAGIDVADIDLDRVGAWQRVPTSDKPHKRNGSVLLWCAYPLNFFFKNYATEIQGVYKDADIGTRPVSAPAVDRAVDYAKSAAIAQQNWDAAQPVDGHRYLENKGIKSHGLRQIGHKLIVPAYDTNRFLWTYQSIDEDGHKRFLKGGKKQGCYFALGGMPKRWLLVAEGYATAASLYECLGLPVATCFDCGNLLPVTEGLAKRFPNTSMVLCADNDKATPGNPGVTKAKAVQKMIKQVEEVIFPEFSVDGLTDWNDAHQAAGEEIVRELFAAKGVGLWKT